MVTGVNPDSPAQEAGLREGDVILEINRKQVKTTDEFAKQVKKADKEKPLLLLVQRGRSTIYVPLKWQEKK